MPDPGGEDGVPQWWQPEESERGKAKLTAPHRGTKRIGRGKTGPVLKRLGEAAEERGLKLSTDVYTRADGASVGTGVDETGLFPLYYRWILTHRDEELHITEEQYPPNWIRYSEASLYVFLAATFSSLYLSVSFGLPIAFAEMFVIFSLASMVSFPLVHGIVHTDEIIQTFDGVMLRESSALLTRVVLVLPGASIALLSMISTDLFLLVSAGTNVVIAVGLVRFHHSISGIPDFSVYLPAGGTECTFVAGTALVPLGMIAAGRQGLLPLSFEMAVFMTVFSGVMATFITGVFAIGPAGTVDSFKRGGPRYVPSHRIHGLVFALCIIFGWGTLLLYVDVAGWILTVLSGDLRLPMILLFAGLVSAVIVLLPATYLWLGLLTQAVRAVTTAVDMLRTLGDAEPVRASLAKHVQTPVVVIQDDLPNAYALDLLFIKRIIVTTALLDQLSPQEVKAILAHEDAHVQMYNDALLSTVAPLVSTLLLAGQSSLLGLLDYYTREHRADRHAAEVTSPAILSRALKKLSTGLSDHGADSQTISSVFHKPRIGRLPPALPGATSPADTNNRLVSYFHPLFSAFAVVDAHPSVNERISYITETFGENPD